MRDPNQPDEQNRDSLDRPQEAGAAVPVGATSAGEPPTAYVSPSAREPVFGPYVSVLLYIVGYFVVGIVLAMGLAIVLGLLVGFGAIQMPPVEQELAAVDAMDIEGILKVMEPYLLPIVIATGLYSIAYTWAFARILDRRRLRDYGVGFRRGWLGDFGKGAALAILILGVIFVFSLTIGSIRVEGFARAAPEGTSVLAYLAGALLAFLSVGVYEELMFRGYVLQRLNDRAGRLASIIVSSLIFAVLHGFNPGADAFGILNTTLIGVILCVLFFRTGSLWMPIGFHTAWNFSLGYLYSLPVSGIPLYGVLKVVEVDPDSRLTGGSYGPEAGLACTLALAVWGGWLIWKRTGRGREEN